MSSQKTKRTLFASLLVIAASLLIATAGWVVVNRQFVVDQLTVWSYDIEPETMELVERSGMNEQGQFYYHASQPKLETTQEFNTICQGKRETAAVLGCYRDRQIYIYDVTDPRLDGIREVTASHETLHAVYERMDESQKAIVNDLLQEQYELMSNNKKFTERVAVYNGISEEHRLNELHSIFATEVENLTKELAEYYDMYFEDRSQVLSLYESYKGILDSIEAEKEDLAKQINALGGKISNDTVEYNSRVLEVNAKVKSFNQRANSGWFTSEEQFEQERSNLLEDMASVEALKDQINSDVDLYNRLLAEYSLVSTESKQLYEKLDSTLAPPARG